MDFGIAGVAAITVIAYAVGQAMRALGRLDRWIPTVCAALGGALGVAGLYIMPGFPAGGRHHRRRHRRGVGPGGHRRPAGGEAVLHRAGLRQGEVSFAGGKRGSFCPLPRLRKKLKNFEKSC